MSWESYFSFFSCGNGGSVSENRIEPRKYIERERSSFRDVTLYLSDDEFKTMYRVSRKAFAKLVNLLEKDISKLASQ